MERYRVNYWLLGTLVIGAALLGGSVYGIWRFQMGRNADQFQADADEAMEQGEYKEAQEHLAAYLNLDPNDRETMLKLATVRLKLAEEMAEDREYAKMASYANSVENTLSRFPAELELRRELADFYLSTYRTLETLRLAASHYQVLLNDSKYKDDIEIKKQRGVCLVSIQQDKDALTLHAELVGYDPSRREFNEEPGPAADDYEVYSRLAAVLLQRLKRPEEAAVVLDKLVERNPESGRAYLTRGQLRPALAAQETREANAEALREKAKQDIEKAYELDPEDEGILFAYISQIFRKGVEFKAKRQELADDAGLQPGSEQQAELDELEQQADNEFDKAAKLAVQAIAKFPENAVFYNIRARIAELQDNLDSAIAEIDKGVDSDGLSEQAALSLQIYKADMLLKQSKIEETEKFIAELRKQPLSRNPLYENRINIIEARVALSQNRWMEGQKLLERTRSQMPMSTPEQRNELANVDYLLGFSFENLGMRDLAVASYNRSLQNMPQNPIAQAGIDRLRSRTFGGGRTVAAVERSLIQDELSMPADQRDWKAVLAKSDDYAAERGFTVEQASLLRAEIYARMEDFASARKEVEQIFRSNPEDLGAWRYAAKLLAADPERGPAEAIKLLDRASSEENFGDIPVLRVDRADMLIALNDDDLTAQLMALTEGIEGWKIAEKVQLYSSLGRKFLMLRKTQDAIFCMKKVVEYAPSDLKTLETLFALALDSRDDEEMEAVQAQILDVVKTKKHPNYMYTEAARLFSQLRRDKIDDVEAAKKEIRSLLGDIVEQRSEWPAPYLMYGDLELAYGDQEQALNYMGKGLELGSNNAVAALTYIRMLTQRGRYFKARDAVERFDDSLRVQVLGRVYAEILRRTNSPNEAFDAAVELAEAKSGDPGTQLWFGKFLTSIANSPGVSDEFKQLATERAGAALAKVVEIAPESQDAWIAYITYLRTTDDLPATEQAIRDSQIALPEDAQPGVLARGYELVGRWFDAENLYREIYENGKDQPRAVRALAQFYLGPVYNREDKVEKATILINELLQFAADDKVEVADPHIQWARRQAARILSSTRDYQSLLKAEKLLRSGAIEGQELPMEDRLEMATILSPRPEPESRQRAIAIYESIQPYQDLTPEQELTLAQLYNKTGNWAKCRSVMTGLTAKYPKVPTFRIVYIRMLLDRGGQTELMTAKQQHIRLAQLIPDAAETQELMAFLAQKTGDEEKAQQAIRRLAQKIISQPSPNQAGQLLRLAQLLTQLDDNEAAGAIYQRLSDANPDDFRYKLSLAKFLGANGKDEEAFEILKQEKRDVPSEAIIQTALQILREGRDDFGDKHDQLIGGWIASELRENPGSVTVLLQQAEMKDTQREYEAAAAIYRSLLDSQDLEGRGRAIVLNNLAYLIGLGAASEATPGEALGLVKQAEAILGPSSDILDTRAVIEIENKNYQEAADLMGLAVTDGPTASKYLHKAQAHLGLGQNRLAIEAWDQAVSAGLDAESVNRLEKEAYEKALARITELNSQ